MRLNYCFEPEEGVVVEAPTENIVLDCFARLSVDDFLILETEAGEYVQTRREGEDAYLLEYQADCIHFTSRPDAVSRGDAEKALLDFLHFGPASPEFLGGREWALSSYQPDFIAPEVQDNSVPDDLVPPPIEAFHSNGIEFEEFVARTLNRDGWETRLTKRSGDQGLDLLATDERYRVAIQCKRYSAPVGNSAVQEVHAAADFAGSTHAIVVTTSSFTTSAMQLAESLGVILLNEEQLADLRSHLVFITPRSPRRRTTTLFRE